MNFDIVQIEMNFIQNQTFQQIVHTQMVFTQHKNCAETTFRIAKTELITIAESQKLVVHYV